MQATSGFIAPSDQKLLAAVAICDKVRRMRRREFLILSAASVGGVIIYSLDGKASLAAQDKSAADLQLRIPLKFFTQSEAMVVAAAASRIFPSDEEGPGAREAGVVIFIDRQLAGPWGRDGHRYTHPPFDETAAEEFGNQGAATPQKVYREGLKQLAGFDQLGAAAQDESLKKIEKGAFFNCCAATPSKECFAIRNMAEMWIWSDGSSLVFPARE